MKKNKLEHALQRGRLVKYLVMMKAVWIIVLASVLHVGASTTESYSQSTRLDIQLRNADLEKVLWTIKKRTEFNFFYNSEDVKEVRGLDISLKNATAEEILNECLDGTDLTYEIMHKAVIIKKAEKELEVGTENQVLEQPGKELKGKVVNARGEPIPGVAVMLKGTTMGTITNADGIYLLKGLNNKQTLVFSFIGMKSKEVAYTGQPAMDVTLEEELVGLEEVVVVGYGIQKKISLTGSVSSVSNKEIMKAPVGNVASALTGIMPGLTVVNTSGHVGKDDPTIRLRGIGTMSGQLDPLIMVDGMERSTITDIDPNEIESVTILKDASSTAVFGVRGANGVILVNTKRGKDGPARVSFAAEYGIQTPTRLPKFLDSYEYALLYNEAQINDGVNPANVKFSEQAIEHYRTGDDPWFYPNTDWQDQMMRDISPQQRYNLNISGGTQRTRYYISTGYLFQQGIWKDFNLGYDNTDNFKRYNFRSNLDIDVTDMMTASINLSGSIKNINSPTAKRGTPSDEDWQFFRWMWSAPPMAGAGWVDGKIYKVEGWEVPLKYVAGYGYRNNYDSDLNFMFGLNHKLDFITKGLAVHAKYGYDSFYRLTLRRERKNVEEWAPQRLMLDVNRDGVTEETIKFKRLSTNSELGYGKSIESRNRNIYFEASVDWQRTFAQKHYLTALALYNQSKKYYVESTYNEIPVSYMGFVGRFTYSFKNKYNAEVNVGYNGSENFPKNSRFGFFPSFSGSWVVSEESFIKNYPFISFLKLKASYGIVGNDKLGSNRFIYIPDRYTMSYTGGPLFGTSGSGQGFGTASLLKHGNPDVTWEIDHKQNYGFEISLMNKFSLNFDYFHNYRTDILISRSTYTSYVDDLIPATNFGKMLNRGYELESMWKDSHGEFSYWIKGIYAFARNKVVEMDEPTNIPEHQKQTGRPFGAPNLYLDAGFYETDQEVKAANGLIVVDGIARNTLGQVRKGDLKYVDWNKDGKIDDLDRVSYGNYSLVPEITGSISLGASFKGFDFSLLFQGVTHALITYGGESLQPFVSQYTSPMSAQTYIRGRWTEETKDKATYPALTVIPGHYNYGGVYGGVNEFFTDDASYIRLKTAEVGYNISSKLLSRIKCQTLRIYINGSNLITWDKQRLFKSDPEQPGGRGMAYPQAKIYNIGLNMQF